VLPHSIGSVLRQTFADYELLVVGDCCTDESEAVVTAIADPRVRWINLPENSGHQSAPNNEGLRQARGEIIAYLGHDDLWLPHHLETHVAALDESGADVAYSLGVTVDDFERVAATIPRTATGSFSSPLCTTHRKRVTDELGGWRDFREVRLPPDVELWRRMRAAGRPFVFVNRLTGVKFPALWRRDVYRTRPSHQQAAWLRRIDADRELEAHVLVDLIARNDVSASIPYVRLLRLLFRATAERFRRRIPALFLRTIPRTIEGARRFKGL
jgi:glycosyltransferase involved in cell wall biosynthesis